MTELCWYVASLTNPADSFVVEAETRNEALEIAERRWFKTRTENICMVHQPAWDTTDDEREALARASDYWRSQSVPAYVAIRVGED